MQKRGVFVDAEDFLPVTATYPEHPISKNIPHVRNIQELKDKRAASYKNDVINKMHEFEKFAQVVKPAQSRVPDEGYVAEPKYTSIN